MAYSFYYMGKKVNLTKIFVSDDKGFLHDISGAVLIKDYLESETLPEVDILLDWRSSLVEQSKNNKEYPPEWYEREIMATDYLLRKHKK